MSEIPRPNFIKIPQNYNALTPPRSPERFTVQNRVKSASPTPPSSPSRHSLPQADRKALKTLLSLTRSIDNTSERLYDFCEHSFNEELASLMVDFFEKHLKSFKELKNMISSQKVVSEILKTDKTPSPVQFQLNLSSVEEDWPEPETDAWIDVASCYIRGPPELTSPRESRESLPLEERLHNAAQNRKIIENAKRREIRKQTNRVRRVVEKRKQQSIDAENAYKEKLDAAEQRREEFLNQKKEKARSETEKAQETKYMIELEAEGKRAVLTRKSDEIIKRHETMVRNSREKARERALIKSPPRKLQARKKMAVKKGSLSLAEALSCGQLPGDIFIDEASDGQWQYPNIPEPKETLNPHANEIVARIEKNPSGAKVTCSFLKQICDYRYGISSTSKAGNALAVSINDTIRNNAVGSDTMLRHVITMTSKSTLFCLRVATESLAAFPSLCSHINSLSCVKEMIALCTKLAGKGSPIEVREFIIDRLSSSVALDSICFLLSACGIEDLANKTLSFLIQAIIELIQAMADLYFEGRGDKASGVECTVRAIGPSIIVFLAAMAVDTTSAPHDLISSATIALSYLIAALPSAAKEMIDEQLAASINSVMRSFLRCAEQSQAGRHLIVLFGLLCKESKVVRESCVWPPEPTVLQLLCALPLEFFIKKDGAAVLLPTIAAFCNGNEANTKYVKENLNTTLIAKFLNRTPPNPSSITSISYRISQEDITKLIKVLTEE